MFSNCVYIDKRVYIDKIINNFIRVPNIAGVLRYSTTPYFMEGVYNIGFIDDALLNAYTSLIFPPKATDYREKQAQEMKYHHCVNTMAKLFQKYAPKVLH